MNSSSRWKNRTCSAVLVTAAALGGAGSWYHRTQPAEAAASSDAPVDLESSYVAPDPAVAGRGDRPGAVDQLGALPGAPTSTSSPSSTTASSAPVQATAPSVAHLPSSSSAARPSTAVSPPAPVSSAAPVPQSVPPAAAVKVAAPVPAVSGAGVPSGDLPGWSLVLAEDFTRDAPLGNFASTYKGWAGYDGARDTSRNGVYNSATTTSVQGGVVDENLHKVGATAQVAALTPTPDGRSWGGQQYGRYAVRFKADSVPGYKMAWLLWPSSNNWKEGELDFPEADLDGTVKGFAHDVNGNPSHNSWTMDTGTSMADWHTAVLEWAPGRLTYSLDGKASTTTDPSSVPSDPMRWVLQTETQLSGGAPSAGAAGHVYIDWVAAWRPS